MEMFCIAKCIKINKKSKAQGFQTLEVGDIMTFSTKIKAAGSSRGRTYASYIKCENKRTGEIGYQSFNEIGNRLGNYEFEHLNSKEM